MGAGDSSLAMCTRALLAGACVETDGVQWLLDRTTADAVPDTVQRQCRPTQTEQRTGVGRSAV